MEQTKWFQRSYRRNLVDMHIDDWDESFLSKLDPVIYVEMLKTANVQSAMVYANSHIGYCFWPTKNGQMHRGLRGRDFLGIPIRVRMGDKRATRAALLPAESPLSLAVKGDYVEVVVPELDIFQMLLLEYE